MCEFYVIGWSHVIEGNCIFRNETFMVSWDKVLIQACGLSVIGHGLALW